MGQNLGGILPYFAQNGLEFFIQRDFQGSGCDSGGRAVPISGFAQRADALGRHNKMIQ